MTKTYIIVALVSYLLGSIPFGYILVKLFLKQDIRATGSGNIGATNVARSGAKGLAIATLVLDAVKGAAAVILTHHYWFHGRVVVIDCSLCATVPLQLALLFAIVGHMFPVWLGFRGGKGVATALGGFFFINPVAVIACAVVFFVVVFATRFISLGSILAALLLPIALVELDTGRPAMSFAWPSVIMCAFIILKHHENIRRLLAGTEHKFGSKKSVPPPEAMEKQA